MSSESIELKLKELEDLEGELLQLAMDCLNAYKGALYPFDLYTSAAAKRSMALASGFRKMISIRNMICAGSLLRLQLDIALRLYAAFRAGNPHEFANQVMDGAEIRKIKDKAGNRMTDQYLVECLAAESVKNEWIKKVYRETSGYIHFSSKHMFSIWSGANKPEQTLEIQISAQDVDLPDIIYIEAIEAFIASTRLFMQYLHGWGITKQYPEEVAKLREARELS